MKKDVKVSLYECKTIGDLTKYLTKLKTPCQAMSLIGSPQTFCLIFLNPNSVEMQERLSLTLYYTLHNEFFSLSSPNGESKRKLDLLCRINQLQDFFQHGLPVAGRFLAEYLTMWNGEDYFFGKLLTVSQCFCCFCHNVYFEVAKIERRNFTIPYFLAEICKMLVYLQITDFNELDECILSPIRTLFNSKLSSVHQLFILNYLSRLAMHWATIEYENFKNGREGPFPSAKSMCEDPMASLAHLVETISELAQSGLCQIIRKDMSPDLHRTHLNIYIHESISIFMTVSLHQCSGWKSSPANK